MFQIAAGVVDFLAALVIHIGQTHADQLAGKFIKFREIVGSEMDRFLPLESQPFHIIQDGIHKFLVFLGGVRIIETHIGGAMILFAQSEIQADALHMTDVKIAVRFRRETGEHPSIGIDVVFYVFINFRFNKISGFSFFFHRNLLHFIFIMDICFIIQYLPRHFYFVRSKQ